MLWEKWEIFDYSNIIASTIMISKTSFVQVLVFQRGWFIIGNSPSLCHFDYHHQPVPYTLFIELSIRFYIFSTLIILLYSPRICFFFFCVNWWSIKASFYYYFFRYLCFIITIINPLFVYLLSIFHSWEATFHPSFAKYISKWNLQLK